MPMAWQPVLDALVAFEGEQVLVTVLSPDTPHAQSVLLGVAGPLRVKPAPDVDDVNEWAFLPVGVLPEDAHPGYQPGVAFGDTYVDDYLSSDGFIQIQLRRGNTIQVRRL
jgi:hypothetical protein